MINYQLFCLKDGRISGTAMFDAEGDVAAVEAAYARGNAEDCELWCGSRLVAFIRPKAMDET